MTTTIGSGFIQHRSPQMQSVHREIRDVMQVALLRAVGHVADPRNKVPADAGSIEQGFVRLVQKLKVDRPAQWTRLASRFSVMSTGGALVSGIDLKGSTVAKQLLQKGLATSLVVTPEMKDLKSVQTYANYEKWLLGTRLALVSDASTEPPPAPTRPNPGKALRFYIDKIRCIDKQEPFFFEDEILCGGVGLDTSARGIKKVPQFRLKSNRDRGTFKDGTSSSFSPPIKFVEFSMAGAYPRVFTANILLFEKDGNGIADILQALWDSLGEDFTEIVAGLAASLAGLVVGAVVSGSELGLALGSAVPGLGTAIGLVAGALAGLVLGAIVAGIIEIFRDDLIGDPDEAVVPFAALESITSRFPGGRLRSGRETFEYRNAGARYELRGYWEIIL